MTNASAIFRLVFTCLLALPTCMYSQTVSVSNQHKYFQWNPRSCPDYKSIASALWERDTLSNLANRIESSVSNRISFKIDKARSVEIIQYSYHFKAFAGGDKDIENEAKELEFHDFTYLIEIPSRRIILTGIWTNQSESGSLEYIHTHHIRGRLIFETQYDSGGTAGYWEEYFTIRDGYKVPIKESFVDQANAIIPKGYSVRRVQVDIENLSGTVYLATDSDANCCPSGRLDLKLAYQSECLTLVSGEFHEN